MCTTRGGFIFEVKYVRVEWRIPDGRLGNVHQTSAVVQRSLRLLQNPTAGFKCQVPWVSYSEHDIPRGNGAGRLLMPSIWPVRRGWRAGRATQTPRRVRGGWLKGPPGTERTIISVRRPHRPSVKFCSCYRNSTIR